jgi:hypothetical protein
VVTFAVKSTELISKIPPCLQLDTFKDEWAFIAVAIVQTKHLRPAIFPGFLGMNFLLIGYRVFVTYLTSHGKRLRGLYILRSETDKLLMRFAGNIFTHYRYSKTDVSLHEDNETIKVYSGKSEIAIRFLKSTEPRLPNSSPFESWKEARRFAGPLPFTFYVNSKSENVLIVEGVRQSWVPKPIEIAQCKIGFIEDLNLKTVVPANAFLVENVSYHWKKGIIDVCSH